MERSANDMEKVIEEKNAIVKRLEDLGYKVGSSDLDEIIIEFLLGEIGVLSADYVAGRYEMDLDMAQEMLDEIERLVEANN